MPESTFSVVSLPPKDAIAFFRQKTNTTSRHWTDLWNEAHSRSFMVAGAATEALVADFRREVARALEEGSTLADFRKQFDAIVRKHGWAHTGSPGWRASIIYETNLSTAYSAGRYRQMTEPDTLEAFPNWRYQHNPSQHPRAQHLAWDGLVLPASDPWWNTHWPPNGWRCRCSVEPMSDRELARSGRTGPDTTPAVDARPWTNPHTGERLEVPHGIDPGFGYNPGQAWLDGEAGSRVAQGHSPTRPPAPRPPLRAESVPAPAGVRGSAPAPIATPGELRRFVKDPIGTIDVAPIAPAIAKALGTEASTVQLSADTIEKQATRHAELTAEDYAELPATLAHPDVVVRQSGTHALLFRRGRFIYRAVVKVTQDLKSLYVVSFHRTRPSSAVQALRSAEIVYGVAKDLEE